MNTEIKNGDVMNNNNHLNMKEIEKVINYLFLNLENDDDISSMIEKPDYQNDEMTLWINGIDFDEGDYQKLEHMWYCYNVYKTTPRMSKDHWRLLNEIIDCLDKIVKESKRINGID